MLIVAGALVVGGCQGSSSTGIAIASPSPTGTRSSTSPSTQQASIAPPSTATAPSLSLVGLGDSIPGAMNCVDPCRSYVVGYGELASTALKRRVVVTNLATNDGLTTVDLLERVRTDPTHRAALTDADLITVTIGSNDWQGPCYWDGHDACFEHGRTTVEKNLGLILDEIRALRGTKPTAIRVTTQYDFWVGNPGTPDDWGFPRSDKDLAAFHAAFKHALINYNTTVCRVAIAHKALCIDIAPAFNGPDLDRDAGPLLGADHGHLTAAGQDLVAATIVAAGFAPFH